MRVLIVLDWNPGRGGTEVYAQMVRDGLRRAGDEVRLLTSTAGTAGDGTADYAAFGTAYPAAQTLLQIANPFAASTVRRAVAEFRPDVAFVLSFAYHLSPDAIFALGRVPLVLSVVDYKYTCPLGSKLLPDGSLCAAHTGLVCHRQGCLSLPHWLRDSVRYVRIRKAVARARCVLTCSDYVRRDLAQSGIAAETLLLPVEAASPGFTRRPTADPTFLYCGRLEREKGVDLLVRAFARLLAEFPDARLRIAGSGSQNAALQQLAASLGAAHATSFLGWLSLAQIEDQLAEAWASVVPSRTAEPFGLVPVEAAVRRVPVIATYTGGPAETVRPATGLLFARDNADALFECLRAIASGAVFPARSVSAAAALEAAQRFSVDRHIADLRTVFHRVLAAPL